jgi:hypothetical protein
MTRRTNNGSLRTSRSEAPEELVPAFARAVSPQGIRPRKRGSAQEGRRTPGRVEAFGLRGEVDRKRTRPSGRGSGRISEAPSGATLGGSEPELVRQDRGAGDLRVTKLTNTGKSMSRRRRGLAETPALLLYAGSPQCRWPAIHNQQLHGAVLLFGGFLVRNCGDDRGGFAIPACPADHGAANLTGLPAGHCTPASPTTIRGAICATAPEHREPVHLRRLSRGSHGGARARHGFDANCRCRGRPCFRLPDSGIFRFKKLGQRDVPDHSAARAVYSGKRREWQTDHLDIRAAHPLGA